MSRKPQTITVLDAGPNSSESSLINTRGSALNYVSWLRGDEVFCEDRNNPAIIHRQRAGQLSVPALEEYVRDFYNASSDPDRVAVAQKCRGVEWTIEMPRLLSPVFPHAFTLGDIEGRCWTYVGQGGAYKGVKVAAKNGSELPPFIVTVRAISDAAELAETNGAALVIVRCASS